MSIPEFHSLRNWTNPADFPTHQSNEQQNRADLQEWFTRWETYWNNQVLPALNSMSGGGSGGGTGTGGVSGDFLPLDGGTMRGPLRLYHDPVVNAESATKRYVDSAAGRVAADAEGNFTAIRQDAEEIELLAQSNQGEIGSLKVRADAIESQVYDADGNGSDVKQTVDAIKTLIYNANGDISAISQTLDGISMSVSTVTENGVVFSKITLKIGERELYGYVRLQGNVDVSGQLSAEALYSGYGEIANLAVDTLITSRRIVKYLAGDTSDDNFIRAYGQNLEWVTGHANGGTAQAKNPDGALLYWPVRINGLSLGDDGYPVNRQGERIFTTTTRTDYAVMVYTYDEEIKRSISFNSVNGIYSPIDRFGAGNAQGNNRAWILKTADGFDIRYLTPDGREIGIRMGTDGKVTIDGFSVSSEAVRDALTPQIITNALTGGGGSGDGASGGGEGSDAGFNLTRTNLDGTTSGISVDTQGHTDISGLRKPVTIDFSGLASGEFYETLDGGVYNRYVVTCDGSGYNEPRISDKKMVASKLDCG